MDAYTAFKMAIIGSIAVVTFGYIVFLSRGIIQ